VPLPVARLELLVLPLEKGSLHQLLILVYLVDEPLNHLKPPFLLLLLAHEDIEDDEDSHRYQVGEYLPYFAPVEVHKPLLINSKAKLNHKPRALSIQDYLTKADES
jgi:hypothetical protein